MAGQPEVQQTDALVQEVEPVVRGIIRRKLRITLDPADGRRENQNGLELFGDVWVKLLQEVRTDSIRNVRSYAAVITYHACSEYFRDKYPARSSLKNRVHYFLTHHPEYAVWESDTGDPVGGFARWQKEKIEPAPSEKLSGLAPGALAKPVERMEPRDWDALFDSVFQTLGAPAALDELVNAIAPLVGSVDQLEAETKQEEDGGRDVIINTPGSDPLPDEKLWIRLQLQRLWIEILQLLPRQRMAYLLNPTEGEIAVFPANGIASIVDIGRSIAISGEQFALLSKELALPGGSTHDEKFAMLWNKLPLNDKLIGKLLAATPQQVINLRKVARERLGRQMKNFR
jgi:hypothetical protein